MDPREELRILRRIAELEGKSKQAPADNLNAETLNPTTGMGFGEKLAAGAGKAIVDTGRGLGQMVGLVSRDDVAESRKRDAALMNTGAGITGNIGGNIGMALLPGAALKGLSAVPALAGAAPALSAAGGALMAPKTISGAAALGAGMGLVQPSTSTGETVGNMALGGVASAAVPVAMRGLQSAKAAAEPLTDSGQQAILGRLLRKVSGDDPNVLSRLQSAQQLVPGSVPTVGQASGNAGIAGLERTTSQMSPEMINAFSTRIGEQNAARVNALEGMTGGRQAAVNARSSATEALYDAAKGQNVNIDSAMTELMNRPSMKTAWAKAQKLAADKGEKISFPGSAAKEVVSVGADGVPTIVQQGATDAKASVRGLHYLKLALDDILENPGQNAIGRNEAQAIGGNKKTFLDWLETRIPEYGQARETFKKLSRPINQIDVAQEIADKSINKLTGTIQPGKFANALSDDTAARATGFDRATLAGTMEPQQLALLNNIKTDLARAVAAQNAGRGPGSDTVQKLAYSNFIDAAGVPTWLRNMSAAQFGGNVLARGSDALYGRANKEMANRLAETMMDPQTAAQMMQRAVDADPRLMMLLSRIGASGGLALPGIVNAQKQ